MTAEGPHIIRILGRDHNMLLYHFSQTVVLRGAQSHVNGSDKDELVPGCAERLSAKHGYTAINLRAHSCETVRVACFNSGLVVIGSLFTLHPSVCVCCALTLRVTNSETDTLCRCIKQWVPPLLTAQHTSQLSPPSPCLSTPLINLETGFCSSTRKTQTHTESV